MIQPKILKRGEIAVNRKALVAHCNVLLAALNEMDIVMKEPESVIRGKKIAAVCNKITFTLHTVKHFELNLPLSKGNKFIK